VSFFTTLTLFGLGQFAWVIVSTIWLWKRRDEVPLLVSALLFYVFTFRFWAILQGWAAPANLTNFGFEPISGDDCLAVLRLAFLGETVWLIVYMLWQKRHIDLPAGIASPLLLDRLRKPILLLAMVCIPLALYARQLVQMQTMEGKSLGFEVSSYLGLFPLSLVGVAILLAALWKAGGLPSGGHKFFVLFLFALIGYLTFQPSLRFQFLGWLLAAVIIFSSGYSFARRGALVIFGVICAISLFALAGALRHAEGDPEVDLQQTVWERFAFAHDANMLDGFALLRQVYPDRLDYSFGREHLEIFQRPIPRAWWPGKPVGGYMNKLGIITADTGFTLGISPSLFGSFFQEGGVSGVVILSALYSLVFASLVRYTIRIHPLAGLLIRGVACAALVPLLRGGDLPGIYAWFGMSFWPIALLLWLRRHELLAPVPDFRAVFDGRSSLSPFAPPPFLPK
jgi:hypothetical protein